MSKATVKVQVNWNQILSRERNTKRRATMQLKNEIVKDTHKYVPYKKGETRSSAQRSIFTSDPKIVYAPVAKNGYVYARKLYEGIKFNFKTIGTRARWYEYSKTINGRKWVNNIRRIYKNEFH